MVDIDACSFNILIGPNWTLYSQNWELQLLNLLNIVARKLLISMLAQSSEYEDVTVLSIYDRWHWVLVHPLILVSRLLTQYIFDHISSTHHIHLYKRRLASLRREAECNTTTLKRPK